MNLLDLFDLSLIGRRDEPALEFERRAFTFGEIDSRSSRMAEALRRRGIRPGDRLCVYLANCVEMIDIYLACLKLGAIFVPINILYRDREIAHIVADAEPKAVVTRGALEIAAHFGRFRSFRATRRPRCPSRTRWRHSRCIGLHIRNHRRFEGRHSHAQ